MDGFSLSREIILWENLLGGMNRIWDFRNATFYKAHMCGWLPNYPTIQLSSVRLHSDEKRTHIILVISSLNGH